jgi:hypothetical protein
MASDTRPQRHRPRPTEKSEVVINRQETHTSISLAIVQRFRFFVKDAKAEVPAEIGKAGPENAGLTLGAEPFALTFQKGEQIDLSLKQFVDVLSTCIFVRAEIALAIK